MACREPLRKGFKQTGEAKQELEKFHYPESISASQETMGLSLKATFLYLEEEYPKTHEFTDEQFLKIVNNAPDEIQKLTIYPRLLLISRLWSNFYAISKYGNEKLGVGPEHLLRDLEAKMALEHAKECHVSTTWLRDWFHRREAVTGLIHVHSGRIKKDLRLVNHVGFYIGSKRPCIEASANILAVVMNAEKVETRPFLLIMVRALISSA